MILRQTAAIFLDAYRELNAKKMFWIVMVLTLVCVGALASVGLYEQPNGKGGVQKGISLLFWNLPPMPFLDVIDIPKSTFYYIIFFAVGVSLWLTWAATILALISTAGIIPDFITGGSVEMSLSKPIGRLRLFLTKYLAGLLFVVLQVGVFSAASWMVIGVRSGAWNGGIFLAVPVVTVLFSYLFAFQVLIGMVTRSAIASLLITVCLWLCIFALHMAETIILESRVRSGQETALREVDVAKYREQVEAKRAEAAAAEGEAKERLDQTVGAMETVLAGKETRLDTAREGARTMNNVHAIMFAAKTVLPKTSETTELLQRWLVSATEMDGIINAMPDPPPSRRRLMDDVRVSEKSVQREIQNIVAERSVMWVMGTSLLFEACIVGIAAWLFCRRDF
jgi:ABC-type transport system involved in multi-copper enzyme maturation permease subunit